MTICIRMIPYFLSMLDVEFAAEDRDGNIDLLRAARLELRLAELDLPAPIRVLLRRFGGLVGLDLPRSLPGYVIDGTKFVPIDIYRLHDAVSEWEPHIRQFAADAGIQRSTARRTIGMLSKC